MTIRLGASMLLVAACSSDPGVRPTNPDPGTTDGGAVTPTPGPQGSTPEGWSTYVDSAFGFAFDHPSDWIVDETRSEETGAGAHFLSVRMLGPEEADPVVRDHAIGRFSVDVLGNPDGLDVRKWLDTYGWPFGGSNDGTSSIVVSGVEALDVTTGRMFSPNRFVYLSWKRVVVRIAPIAAEAGEVLDTFRLQE